jgi:hypothetical protein
MISLSILILQYENNAPTIHFQQKNDHEPREHWTVTPFLSFCLYIIILHYEKPMLSLKMFL